MNAQSMPTYRYSGLIFALIFILLIALAILFANPFSGSENAYSLPPPSENTVMDKSLTAGPINPVIVTWGAAAPPLEPGQ